MNSVFAPTTIDPDDVERFASLADQWWNEDGPFRPLHKINPARLTFIRDRAQRHFGAGGVDMLKGRTVLDLGCGGGLTAEPLARLGGTVTGLDAAEANVQAARSHAEAQGLAIDYRAGSAEALAATGDSFDIVIALEIIEHVADRDGFLDACAGLLRPGGLMIVSTLSRTLKSLLLGIGAAEYLLGWVPCGTHDWRRFVTPSALTEAMRIRGLVPEAAAGLSYSVLRNEWTLSRDLSVNYLLSATRPPR